MPEATAPAGKSWAAALPTIPGNSKPPVSALVDPRMNFRLSMLPPIAPHISCI
jgi:hypothetical protein